MRRSHGVVWVLLLAGLQRATSNTPDTNYTAGRETEVGNGSGTGIEEPVATTTSAAGSSAASGERMSSSTQLGDGTGAPAYTRAAPGSATSTEGIPPPTSPSTSSVPRTATTATAEAPGGSGPGGTPSGQGPAGTSAAPPGSEDAHGEKSNKGGVIFGVLLGTILGFVLFGLVGYFICGKKNSEPFSHRRLHEDTRGEPGFGGTCRDKTRTPDKEGDTRCPGLDLAMDDVTPAQPSE